MSSEGTSPTILDLSPTALRVAAVADSIRDDQLDAPTPCPELTVRNLLGHVLGLSVAFRDAARKDLGPTTSTVPTATPPDIDDDGAWRSELPKRLEELVEAWRSPAAWQGMTQAGAFDMPGEVAGMVALNELLIHGWDLARATDHPYHPDEASLNASRALLSPDAETRTEGGPFGLVVPVPADAPLLDQVVGLSGRDPNWSPESGK
jgi:uncharacterized protein (TIGR03086 family)